MLPRRKLLLTLAGAPLFSAAAPIRVGCQSRSYGAPTRDAKKFLDVLDDMSAAGYQGFETNFISLEETFGDPTAMRKELENRRLTLVALHAGAEMHSEAGTEKGLALLQRVAHGVKGLGGSYVFLSAAITKDHALWKRKADAITQAAKLCEKAGVKFAVHNHVDEARNNFEEFRFLLAHSNVSLIVDAGHAARAGADAAAFCAEHYKRIVALHVKDWRGDHMNQVTLGTGQVDVRGSVLALKNHGWSGWVLAELEGNAVPGVSPQQNVRNARNYLRQLLGS
jgi:sugar phosphate isomerase/epimerase